MSRVPRNASETTLHTVARAACYGTLTGVLLAATDTAMSASAGHWAGLGTGGLFTALAVSGVSLGGIGGLSGAGLALFAASLRATGDPTRKWRSLLWNATWDGLGAALLVESYGTVWQALFSPAAADVLAPRFLAVHAAAFVIGSVAAAFSWRMRPSCWERVALRLFMAVAFLAQGLYFFYHGGVH